MPVCVCVPSVILSSSTPAVWTRIVSVCVSVCRQVCGVYQHQLSGPGLCLYVCLCAVRYVEFIGTSCLDPEDEKVKREMAERVMRLLLRREDEAGGSETSARHPDTGTGTQGERRPPVTSGPVSDSRVSPSQTPEQPCFRFTSVPVLDSQAALSQTHECPCLRLTSISISDSRPCLRLPSGPVSDSRGAIYQTPVRP